MDQRLPCQACGTWTCAACGWKRHGANLHYPQDCARCGGTSGTLIPTRHHAKRGIWEDHNPVAGPACETWDLTPVINPPYTPFAGPCAHPSCQVITWGHLIPESE
jgi:hypothetical protein